MAELTGRRRSGDGVGETKYELSSKVPTMDILDVILVSIVVVCIFGPLIYRWWTKRTERNDDWPLHPELPRHPRGIGRPPQGPGSRRK
jgi:hypothetical protein